MLFVTDPEELDRRIANLRTEYNTNQYRIKIDRAFISPYYELFYEWKEGKRIFNNLLFASSII